METFTVFLEGIESGMKKIGLKHSDSIILGPSGLTGPAEKPN